MLHVLVGATCNNNCSFCMEADRPGRRAHVTAQTDEDIRAMISAHERRDEVLFTCGEPTQAPALLEHLAWARNEGFRVIGVISNGRRLSYGGVARRLVQAGANRLTVSVHGHTAQLHDSQTRTPGSFQQTVAGLHRALVLRRTFAALEVHTSTVVSRRTLEHVAAIHEFLARLDPDLMVFNVMMPVGRGEQRLATWMPAYAEVAETFGQLAATLDEQRLRQLRLVDLPLCVGRDLPFPLWGEPERFQQYERAGSSGLKGQAADVDPGAARLVADGSYHLTGREEKDHTLRVKPAPCEACAAASTCPGIYRRYVEALGHHELRPLAATDLAALDRGHGKKRRRKFRILPG